MIHTRLSDEITDHRYGCQRRRVVCACGWKSREASGPQTAEIMFGWHVVMVQP